MQQIDKPIEEFTDTELLAVIRRSENPSVPGSLYQRAYNEWNIREQKKIRSNQPHQSGVFFRVGGDMINHGVIKTAKDSVVDIAVAGSYSSNKNTKIVQVSSEAKKNRWYENILENLILKIVIGVIIAGIVYWLGWD